MQESNDLLSITEDGGTITLSGEIDASTVPMLVKHLHATTDDVVVDLSAVGFIDSSGLRALIGAHQTLDGRDSTLTLRNPSPAVMRLFELSSVTTFFTIE